MIRARPEVEAMTPYVAPLEGRRSLLRLDFNESTVGPRPAVVEAVTRRLEARPRLCFICNPNNPTGTLLAPHAITALARSSPDTLVVVDELYVAFTGQSILPAALELPNVLALQSLSKAAGIAALRLAFAARPPPIG